jgi:4-carboxymuconolactone decarboxylase
MMGRLDSYKPSTMDPGARQLYDTIVETRATVIDIIGMVGPSGELAGPWDPLLRVPSIGDAVQSLGLQLRRSGTLPGDVFETAILTVAHAWKAEFECNAHRAIALGAGLLSEGDIDRIANGSPPDRNDSTALAWSFVRQQLETGSVDDSVYGLAVAEFGEPGVVQLTVISGYYTLISMLLRTYMTTA